MSGKRIPFQKERLHSHHDVLYMHERESLPTRRKVWGNKKKKNYVRPEKERLAIGTWGVRVKSIV